MASIRTEAAIAAPPERVWAALRAWTEPHELLVPGFVVATEVDGDDRIVTFFTGAVVRERLVDLDDAERRLVWSASGGDLIHHNASAQALPLAGGRTTRFVWIADFLPDAAGPRIRALMERGTAVIKETLERAVPAR
jgi:uncharacterized protein YndB with AHSA1/START domain